MKYLISYDIASDRKRKKAAKILEDYGLRIQYSVFECELKKNALKKLLKAIDKFVDIKTDSLIIFPLCENCYNKKEFLGKEYNIRKLTVLTIN